MSYVVVGLSHLIAQIGADLVKHRDRVAVGVGVVGVCARLSVAGATNVVVIGVNNVRCVDQVQMHRQLSYVDGIDSVERGVDGCNRPGNGVAKQVGVFVGRGDGDSVGPQRRASGDVRHQLASSLRLVAAGNRAFKDNVGSERTSVGGKVVLVRGQNGHGLI